MLRQRDLGSIYGYLGVPKTGRHYVDSARNSPPSRTASNRFGNTIHTFASRKMGWTVKAESRHAELPFLLHCEFTDSVLEYYDQPPALKLNYTTTEGRNRGHHYTPDFLVIENSRIYLAECKVEKDLEAESAKRPYMYSKDGSGEWQCPPAIRAAADLGLRHIIFTDHDFPPAFTRNCIYLLNFIDDGRPTADRLQLVRDYLQDAGGRLPLKDLYTCFTQPTVIQAVTQRYIFVDFEHDLLCMPDRTWAYANRKTFNTLVGIRRDTPLSPVNSISDLEFHQSLFWGTELWEILNVSKGRTPHVSLRKDKSVVTLNAGELSTLFSEQLLFVPKRTTQSRIIEETIAAARSTDIDIAHSRLAVIQQCRHQNTPPYLRRSLSRWKKAYDTAEKVHGCGFLGLIPNFKGRGNRTPRFSEEENRLINTVINDSYLTPNSPTAYSAYQIYLNRAQKAGLAACSLQAFHKRIRSITAEARLLARKGSRAAYAYAPPAREIDLSWDLPYHGDFIFEVAHIDHTPLEMQLRSKLTGEPIDQVVYLSLMIDGHSRTILAIYLTFEPPSYRSVMMLLRECYRRYNRIPLFLAADNGAEFRSAYYDKTLAHFGVHKRARPPHAARAGSIVERVFSTTETELIHTLEANKGNQKLGRGQSSSHNPRKRALWTPDEFYHLFKDWAYLIYPMVERAGIRETPHARFERSRSKFLETPGTVVECPESFYFDTLPDIKGGLTLNKNQTSFRKITYRLSKPVASYRGHRMKVEARYDPYDLSYILARIDGSWARLFTNDVLVRECKDQGIELPHMEVYPRQARHSRRYQSPATASLLARERISQQEQLLFTQKQAQLGRPSLVGEPPATETRRIELQTLPDLNVSFPEGHGHDLGE